MSLVFEWDPKKAAENLSKHRTSFNEAAEVFYDPLAASVEDPTSIGERRFILVGQTLKRRLLLVVYIERGERIRIISARDATKQEVRIMKKGTSKTSTKAVPAGGRSDEDDMRDDYSFLDWSKAERGKYAKRYSEGTNIVLIEPDLTDVFPNADSVNQALRALAVIIRQRVNPPKRISTDKRKAKLSA